MNLRNISTREQVLIFFVAFTVVAGSYGLLRYRPALKALTELQASNIKTADRAKNAIIPEEPIEDIDDLKTDVASADSELAVMKLSFIDAEQKLAPEDSQELRLRISDVANNAGVRIRENVPYLVPRVAGGTVAAAPAQKLSKRQQRAANKAARRSGGTSPAGAISAAAPTEGGLIYRLTNELDTQRPFQRVSVEGSFAQVQSFIQELGKLPFMVTVTQLQIDLSPITPPAGYPQPLVVTMILAL